jgi:hypothetical protein
MFFYLSLGKIRSEYGDRIVISAMPDYGFETISEKSLLLLTIWSNNLVQYDNIRIPDLRLSKRSASFAAQGSQHLSEFNKEHLLPRLYEFFRQGYGSERFAYTNVRRGELHAHAIPFEGGPLVEKHVYSLFGIGTPDKILMPVEDHVLIRYVSQKIMLTQHDLDLTVAAMRYAITLIGTWRAFALNKHAAAGSTGIRVYP